MKQTYTIGDKQYSREQLIALGKDRYPKFNLIPRFVSFIL